MKRTMRLASVVFLGLLAAGCASMAGLFGDEPALYKSPYYLYQEFVGGSYEDSYRVTDNTEYARKDAILDEEAADFLAGTQGDYEELARSIREANSWIEDEWVVYVPPEQQWETNRDDLGNIVSRRLLFLLIVDNR